MTQSATDVRLPSTRHRTVTENRAKIIGRGIGLGEDVAVRAFTGEPTEMVLAVAEYHENDPERNVNIMDWAQRVGRGVYNPDPEQYQRNADVIPLR